MISLRFLHTEMISSFNSLKLSIKLIRTQIFADTHRLLFSQIFLSSLLLIDFGPISKKIISNSQAISLNRTLQTRYFSYHWQMSHNLSEARNLSLPAFCLSSLFYPQRPFLRFYPGSLSILHDNWYPLPFKGDEVPRPSQDIKIIFVSFIYIPTI